GSFDWTPFLRASAHGRVTTSPPEIVARARYTGRLIPSEMKWTEPSANTKFAPPVWRLRNPLRYAPPVLFASKAKPAGLPVVGGSGTTFSGIAVVPIEVTPKAQPKPMP